MHSAHLRQQRADCSSVRTVPPPCEPAPVARSSAWAGDGRRRATKTRSQCDSQSEVRHTGSRTTISEPRMRRITRRRTSLRFRSTSSATFFHSASFCWRDTNCELVEQCDWSAQDTSARLLRWLQARCGRPAEVTDRDQHADVGDGEYGDGYIDERFDSGVLIVLIDGLHCRIQWSSDFRLVRGGRVPHAAQMIRARSGKAC